jgi:hypothetical protein
VKTEKGMIIKIGPHPTINPSALGLVYVITEPKSWGSLDTGKVISNPNGWLSEEVRHAFDPNYDVLLPENNEYYAKFFLKDDS